MLEIQNSLLLIIDMQERLIQASKYGIEASQNMSKILNAAKILNIPTVVTEQYPKGLGKTVLDVNTENSIIFEKASFSAFQEQNIRTVIEKSGKKQIIIGGIETHICVFQTAIDLLQAGYDVYVAKDCCASRNKFEYKTGLEALKQYGAKIICAEIAIFEWLRTSNHPNFKEVQSLIK